MTSPDRYRRTWTTDRERVQLKRRKSSRLALAWWAIGVAGMIAMIWATRGHR